MSPLKELEQTPLESRLKGMLPRKVQVPLHGPEASIDAARDNLRLASQTLHLNPSIANLSHEVGNNLARHGLGGGQRSSPMAGRFQRMLEHALES